MAHRQRLVDLAKDKSHMDIKFTAFIQCNTVCEEMERHYGEHNIMLRIALEDAMYKQSHSFAYTL